MDAANARENPVRKCKPLVPKRVRQARRTALVTLQQQLSVVAFARATPGTSAGPDSSAPLKPFCLFGFWPRRGNTSSALLDLESRRGQPTASTRAMGDRR